MIFKIVVYIFLILLNTNLLAKKLIIVAESYPPYTYLENKKILGIDAEIARAIFNQLNVKYSLELMPWQRCLIFTKNGNVDVVLTASKEMYRAKYAYYPDTSVWNSSFVFFTNNKTKSKYKINSYEDAKKHKLHVGITRGNSYHAGFWKAFSFQDLDKKIFHSLLVESHDLETNLKILDANRINLFLLPKSVGLYSKKIMNLKNITYYNKTMFTKPYYFIFSKKSSFKNKQFKNIKSLLVAFDKKLLQFKKTKKYKDILDKYRN